MPRKRERRFDQTSKKPNISPEIDRIIGRIKPSVETRDECSLARHIRCFMEVSSDPPEWMRLHKADSLSVSTTKKKKIKKKSRKHKGKVLLRRSSEIDNGNAETFMTNNDEAEYNDICSFDSKVNLSGVALTSADKKIIKKNRRKYHQSSEEKNVE